MKAPLTDEMYERLEREAIQEEGCTEEEKRRMAQRGKQDQLFEMGKKATTAL